VEVFQVGLMWLGSRVSYLRPGGDERFQPAVGVLTGGSSGRSAVSAQFSSIMVQIMIEGWWPSRSGIP
jgi:hypothetical protein